MNRCDHEFVWAPQVDFIWINRDQKSFEWFVSLLTKLEMDQADEEPEGERETLEKTERERERVYDRMRENQETDQIQSETRDHHVTRSQQLQHLFRPMNHYYIITPSLSNYYYIITSVHSIHYYVITSVHTSYYYIIN